MCLHQGQFLLAAIIIHGKSRQKKSSGKAVAGIHCMEMPDETGCNLVQLQQLRDQDKLGKYSPSV